MCGFCGKIDSNYLCKECEKKLKSMEITSIDKFCKKDVYFDEHIYMFKYEGYIRNVVLNYKFEDKAYYYESFVNILINNKKICDFLKSYDIMVAVPIHNKRKNLRGYNQSELIAKKITKNINNLKYVNLLYKKKNTEKQSLLNKEQRKENVKNAYELKNIKDIDTLKNKSVLIFDDIYTTGSTVNECAKIIQRLKPNKIGVLTIAKD